MVPISRIILDRPCSLFASNYSGFCLQVDRMSYENSLISVFEVQHNKID